MIPQERGPDEAVAFVHQVLHDLALKSLVLRKERRAANRPLPLGVGVTVDCGG